MQIRGDPGNSHFSPSAPGTAVGCSTSKTKWRCKNMRWYRSQKVCWDATRPERTKIFSRVRPLMHRNQLNITFPGENRLLPDTSKTALTLTSYVDGDRVQVTRNNGSCAFSTEIHMNHAVTLWFFSHLLKLHNVTHELYLSFLGYGRQFVCGIGQAHKITERQALNIKNFW